jgi:PhzF family phenazine biosynthesis protein
MRLFIVDAFTATPFAGNPAGVVLTEGEVGDGWMQRVAAELNLSETAFAAAAGDGWNLRWFTPQVEVDLCGHATLASAHVLWSTGTAAGGSPVRFSTRSGMLTCTTTGGAIAMDFPAEEPTAADLPAELLEALGAKAVWTGRNRFDAFVEVADEETVRNLGPDLAALAGVDVRGAIVTAAATGPGYDFVSRFFGPAVGVPEDPVTGSAHCALAPFWARRLDRNSLRGRQLSSRGGEVGVELRGDRVILTGQAVTVVQGHLAEPAIS